jgi:uncharacterized protein YggE
MVYDAVLKRLESMMQRFRNLLADVPVLKPMATKSFAVEESWLNRYDDDRRRFEGYTATHTVKVMLPMDMALLGRLLVAIGHADLKPGIRFGFEIMDMTWMRQSARSQSLEAARHSAQHIASQMGLKLIGTSRIQYAMPTTSTPASLDMAMPYAGPDASNSMDLDIAPDDLSVRDEVKVVWRAVPV